MQERRDDIYKGGRHIEFHQQKSFVICNIYHSETYHPLRMFRVRVDMGLDKIWDVSIGLNIYSIVTQMYWIQGSTKIMSELLKTKSELPKPMSKLGVHGVCEKYI